MPGRGREVTDVRAPLAPVTATYSVDGAEIRYLETTSISWGAFKVLQSISSDLVSMRSYTYTSVCLSLPGNLGPVL